MNKLRARYQFFEETLIAHGSQKPVLVPFDRDRTRRTQSRRRPSTWRCGDAVAEYARAGRIAPPRCAMTSPGVERSITMPTLAYSSPSSSALSLLLVRKARPWPVKRLSPSQAAASAASGGKRTGHCVAVEHEGPERTAATVECDPPTWISSAPARTIVCNDGCVGLLRRGDRPVCAASQRRRRFAANEQLEAAALQSPSML